MDHLDQYTLPNPFSDAQKYTLCIRQQPLQACVAIGKDKDHKPIDPPPIVQLTVSSDEDPGQRFLQHPHLFMIARLAKAGNDSSAAIDKSESSFYSPSETKTNSLVGTLVSSLHALKDTTNELGAYFVFGDLAVRDEGNYRIRFVLYELNLNQHECLVRAEVLSDNFRVYPYKSFPGMTASTPLTRCFSEQGVRLRIRKDSRSVMTRKRNANVANQLMAQARRDIQQPVTVGDGFDGPFSDSLYLAATSPYPTSASPFPTAVSSCPVTASPYPAAGPGGIEASGVGYENGFGGAEYSGSGLQGVGFFGAGYYGPDFDVYDGRPAKRQRM